MRRKDGGIQRPFTVDVRPGALLERVDRLGSLTDQKIPRRGSLLAGGCSGHLFKHGLVFGNFVAGVGRREYGTAERFKITGRKKLSPKESPSGR